ncbi:hypothetical protein J3R30DRAFT_96631 [Lentinula aciculospora]|uniref:SMP-30/Gluconolactonase/LRE-like region domain-containing protein n=1 Tax=Lentinula aciculospora TaxID=153920 RepID=A0A9W9DY46_9AGAR|nr:hypothetical protein J3R30DRAFT_96631 [Lentinula aciculospora]
MARILLTLLAVVFALLAILFQIYLSPLLKTLGIFRTVETFGLDAAKCKKIPELQACEKLVLHQPSGIIYLACSTPESRLAWTPAMSQLNAQGRSTGDYIATFDPVTLKIKHLRLENYTSDQPLSVHGMDVVVSTFNPKELFVYVVNHRAPSNGQDARNVGADSVIEVFKTTVSGDRLTHIKTVRDSVILTPNDVAGDADGKGFFFTNDHGSKIAHARLLRNAFSATTSVGYCHLDRGCKIVASGLHANNGIAKTNTNDTVYVASNLGGKISVFERQVDNSLVLLDVVYVGQVLDNLSLDNEGNLWAAAFPKAQDIVEHLTKNPHHLSPVAGFRISTNIGLGSFYGEKYNVEKVFEDNGTIVSGSTSIVYDSERNLLFAHGVAAQELVMCRI